MITRTVTFYASTFTGLSRSAWLLSLVTLINRCGTMVIPFLSIYLTTRLGFSLAQAGITMAIFGLGSFAGSYLGGYLTDRVGYYPVLFWSLLLGGLMFIFLQVVTSVWAMYVTIFLLSTIAESFRPATMTAIAAYSTTETRIRSFSLMRMAINLGWSIGPAVGGVIAAKAGYTFLFWADGLTCVAAALVFRVFLRPKATDETKEAGEATPLPVNLSPYRDATYLWFLLLNVISATLLFQLLSALPVFYKKEVLLDEGQIGGLLALNGIIVVLLEMPLVSVLEKRIHGLHNICIGVLLYGLSFLILALAPGTLALAAVSMIALSVGEIFHMPFTNAFAMNRTTPANRGKYMGLYSMSFSVAHISGPFISLKIADHLGFHSLWWVLTAFSVVVCAAYLFLKKHS